MYNNKRTLLQKLCVLLLIIYPFLLFSQVRSVTIPNLGVSIHEVVKFDNLDTAVYAEWIDGKERHVRTKISKEPVLQTPLWTDKTIPCLHGVNYGISNNLGYRHLRVGFHNAVVVGSIIAEGGGKVSVLKPDAPYPGDFNDESQWIPAQRLVKGQLSDKELDAGIYGVWVLPVGTKTRSIRFSHQPSILDANYSCVLSGAWVTAERLCNRAPESVITTKSSNQKARLVNNEAKDYWGAWANLDAKSQMVAKSPIISKDNQEWILLTWPQVINLNGLIALWSGFSVAEVQTYIGPKDKYPSGGDDSQWQSIAAYQLKTSIYTYFWPNVLDFGQTVKTNAIRLKITKAAKELGNLTNQDLNGKRVWLGELMALESIGNQPLKPLAQVSSPPINPPVAIPFFLKESGYVTLVVENKNGVRVRNLISDTWFNAGKNTALWDGLDDLGRDPEAANHGVYRIPAKLVEPGEYKVRGIVHGTVSKKYEFSVYAPGSPPWNTDSHTGGWLSNHTPPQSTLFVPAAQSPTAQPAVYIGSYIAEGTDGLALLDLDGNKIAGRDAIGGAWTAAPFMARDAGKSADKDVCAYVASVWQVDAKTGLSELRLTGLTRRNDKQILKHKMWRDTWSELGGMAVNDGIAVISLLNKNELMFVDVKAGKSLGLMNMEKPHGLAFDAQNHLLVISSNKLLRYTVVNGDSLVDKQTIISAGLESPVGITLDSVGNIYISDAGNCNQIKAFSSEGTFLRAIGKAGVPKAGTYDSLCMNNPAGITIDSRQHLWVAENDFLPKRISVWSLDGKLLKAFYGPAKYGGGGILDGNDTTKFYYSETYGTMEFDLDWKTGANKLRRVLYRRTPRSLDLGFRGSSPETPVYYNGKRYFTNCYTSNPTYGASISFLFVERNGVVYPAAAIGRANFWDLLKQEKFRSRIPEGLNLFRKIAPDNGFFIWNDLNEDAEVQPEEVTIIKGYNGGITMMNDLSFCFRIDNKAYQLAPSGFSSTGTPFYDFKERRQLVEGILSPVSDGGDQILTDSSGWTVAVQGIAPFDRYSICGAKNGKPSWSYPNLWPGLHPAHAAPSPGFSGELIGPTRLLGGLLEFKGSDFGPLWAINSNMGMVYVFTIDGLFVTTLFDPMKSNNYWKMPIAKRGMSLDGVKLWEENFWPSITQTKEGDVYMCDGGKTALVKIDGLKSIRRLPEISVNVTKEMLDKCRQFQNDMELTRQKKFHEEVLQVPIQTQPITVDGRFDDWQNANWVDIDKNGGRYSYNISGAMAVYGDRLYVGYQTGNGALLKNSGEIATAPFKTGGALDLMIRTNPATEKPTPVEGDLRLLVTVINNKRTALLYRAVVAGTRLTDKVPFSSPWRTITFDEVQDVSNQIEFASTKDGNFEIAVPLAILKLNPREGLTIKGDIGILRGDGFKTISRSYWHNKATTIVSDTPSEAELTPALWGTLTFKGVENKLNN